MLKHGPPGHYRYLALALIVTAVAAAAYLALPHLWIGGLTDIQYVPSQRPQRGWLGPYLNVSDVYRDAGYPIVSAGRVALHIYLESDEYGVSYRLGHVETGLVSLSRAVEEAARAAGLSPSSYRLASATLSPGLVVNGPVRERPEWCLNFVRVFKGFWVFGGLSYYSSVEVRVDALNRAITRVVEEDSFNVSALPKDFTPSLNVSRSEAVEIARSAWVRGVPRDLLQHGELVAAEPRVAVLGRGAKNYLLERVVSEDYEGRAGLYWVVVFSRGGAGFSKRADLLIDAGSGEVVSASYVSMPARPFVDIFMEPDYDSAEGVKVMNFTVRAPSTLLRQLGVREAYLVIENIVVVKPGHAGLVRVDLVPHDIRYLGAPVRVVNLTVTNPLPGIQGGLPPGLKVHFRQAGGLEVSEGRATAVELVIDASSCAEEGAWLLKLEGRVEGAELHPSTYILLSIWSGGGSWPAENLLNLAKPLTA